MSISATSIVVMMIHGKLLCLYLLLYNIYIKYCVVRCANINVYVYISIHNTSTSIPSPSSFKNIILYHISFIWVCTKANPSTVHCIIIAFQNHKKQNNQKVKSTVFFITALSSAHAFFLLSLPALFLKVEWLN